LLKGLPEEYQLNYDKTFSEQSKTIYEKLIPELKRSMEGIFNPSVTQLSTWLRAIHKHRRDRLRKRMSGKLDETDRRLHKNSRLTDVGIYLINSFYSYLLINLYIRQKKNRRIKAALKLYEANSEEIEAYDRDELLAVLQSNDYHSIEQSDSEDEMRIRLPSEKKFLHVYDHPWRSKMVITQNIHI
jgi:hypothetical protein